jgi:hypothetical protein
MSAEEFFAAPWSTLLTVVSLVSCSILFGVILLGLVTGGRGNPFWLVLMVALPLTIVMVTAAFTVRGYILTDNTLYVQRLGWHSKIELNNFVNIEFDAQAMENSLRIWGNGGLFSFTGTFQNQKLGRYQAYATDPARSVIIQFCDRTIVVTPDNPERFVREVLRRSHS